MTVTVPLASGSEENNDGDRQAGRRRLILLCVLAFDERGGVKGGEVVGQRALQPACRANISNIAAAKKRRGALI